MEVPDCSKTQSVTRKVVQVANGMDEESLECPIDEATCSVETKHEGCMLDAEGTQDTAEKASTEVGYVKIVKVHTPHREKCCGMCETNVSTGVMTNTPGDHSDDKDRKTKENLNTQKSANGSNNHACEVPMKKHRSHETHLTDTRKVYERGDAYTYDSGPPGLHRVGRDSCQSSTEGPGGAEGKAELCFVKYSCLPSGQSANLIPIMQGEIVGVQVRSLPDIHRVLPTCHDNTDPEQACQRSQEPAPNTNALMCAGPQRFPLNSMPDTKAFKMSKDELAATGGEHKDVIHGEPQKETDTPNCVPRLATSEGDVKGCAPIPLTFMSNTMCDPDRDLFAADDPTCTIRKHGTLHPVNHANLDSLFEDVALTRRCSCSDICESRKCGGGSPGSNLTMGLTGAHITNSLCTGHSVKDWEDPPVWSKYSVMSGKISSETKCKTTEQQIEQGSHLHLVPHSCNTKECIGEHRLNYPNMTGSAGTNEVRSNPSGKDTGSFEGSVPLSEATNPSCLSSAEPQEEIGYTHNSEVMFVEGMSHCSVKSDKVCHFDTTQLGTDELTHINLMQSFAIHMDDTPERRDSQDEPQLPHMGGMAQYSHTGECTEDTEIRKNSTCLAPNQHWTLHTLTMLIPLARYEYGHTVGEYPIRFERGCNIEARSCAAGHSCLAQNHNFGKKEEHTTCKKPATR